MTIFASQNEDTRADSRNKRQKSLQRQLCRLEYRLQGSLEPEVTLVEFLLIALGGLADKILDVCAQSLWPRAARVTVWAILGCCSGVMFISFQVSG